MFVRLDDTFVVLQADDDALDGPQKRQKITTQRQRIQIKGKWLLHNVNILKCVRFKSKNLWVSNNK